MRNSRIFARARRARRRRDSFLSLITWALLLLGFFTQYDFIRITNAFALVGLWLTICTDFSSNLTQQLLVSAFQYYFGLARGFNGYAFRKNVINRMRETHRQVYSIAFCFSTIADANQGHFLFETLSDTDNHVID